MKEKPYNTQAWREHHKDDASHKYTKWPRCHCCGKPCKDDYGTHPCAGNGDGPGFMLCTRPECVVKYEGMSDAEALAYFEKRLAGRGVDAWDNPVPKPPKGGK